MSAVYRPMSILKKFARALGACISDTHILKAISFYIYDFSRKNGIVGRYLYVYHTLFILYLEVNHTLFGEKLYFIWKFSSGNTG